MSSWMWDGNIRGQRYRMYREREHGNLIVEQEKYGKHAGCNYNYYFDRVYDKKIIKEVMAAAFASKLENPAIVDLGYYTISVNEMREMFLGLPPLRESHEN